MLMVLAPPSNDRDDSSANFVLFRSLCSLRNVRSPFKPFYLLSSDQKRMTWWLQFCFPGLFHFFSTTLLRYIYRSPYNSIRLQGPFRLRLPWTKMQSSIIALLLLITGLMLAYKRQSAKRPPYPPGPPPRLLLGNIFDFPKREAYKVYHEWAKTYG